MNQADTYRLRTWRGFFARILLRIRRRRALRMDRPTPNASQEESRHAFSARQFAAWETSGVGSGATWGRGFLSPDPLRIVAGGILPAAEPGILPGGLGLQRNQAVSTIRSGRARSRVHRSVHCCWPRNRTGQLNSIKCRTRFEFF